MAKLMNCVGNPVKTNERECKLANPSRPPDLPPRILSKPGEPQGNKTKKDRPWVKRNIACANKNS